MTEKATTLRETMKSLGARTRGFALVFLASALGVFVTGVLAMFSVVHIALTGVFLGFAIVSLVIVRTLNLRKREIKARLRNLNAQAAKTTSTAPTPTAPKATGSKASEARPAGSTKAAQARAVMQRNVSARHTSDEEADTGEIPIVRIRNEAAEGHTTRQVLLTGPIPIVEEAAPDVSDSHAAGTDSTETDAVENMTAAESILDVESASEAEIAPRAEAVAENVSAQEDAVVATASNVDTVEVNDPFMQRLQARGAWSPTPLPVPSYVDAPEVEHPVPESTAADASSYETQARSREDIAAQFAAELGYRPELSDSARDDSPLEHGRKAIRTNKAPEIGAIDDVLARRRA